MKVCLVTAATVTEFADDDELSSLSVRSAATEAQLGVLSLAAMLEYRHGPPRILNLNRAYLDYYSRESALGADFADFAAQLLLAEDAELYGFGSICSSYPFSIRVAELVKAARPQSAILFGGPQASVVDLLTLSTFHSIDFILRGEAELTLPILIDELTHDCQLQNVPGLSYRVNSRPQRNQNASVIQDLDKLPSPAYHLTRELIGARRASLELGRGCPFSCTFCSTNDFFRRKFRLRSPERVLTDMRQIHEEYGISDFNLVHDMFTIDRRRVAMFCAAMAASQTGFTWSCSARTDCIDEELLEMMSNSGCRGIFFGIETGSPRLQKIIDKHLDLQRARQIIAFADQLGIHTTVSLITGFPEETYDDLRRTLSVFVDSSRLYEATPQLNLLAPLAETPIYSKHKDELVLEELCSEMSHQARRHHQADWRLIREHPEIFPNFYLVPTPNLDREVLIELREFALGTNLRFRWLMVAIHQQSRELFDIFMEWRDQRLRSYPDFDRSSLRRYYQSESFSAEFLTFLDSHPSSKLPVIRALLEYEHAVAQSASGDEAEATDLPETEQSSASSNNDSPRLGSMLPPEAELAWTDIPKRKLGTTLLELSCDVQGAIESLRREEEWNWQPSRYFYLSREISYHTYRFDRVSSPLAALIGACNGRNTIEKLLTKLSSELLEVEESAREYFCLRLLQGAHAKGLIDVFRSFRPSASEIGNDRVSCACRKEL